MQASIATAILAYLATVSAQGITAVISAPGSAPSGCSASQSGVFGIQIVAASSAAPAKRQVTQIGDGQIQATSAATKPAAPVTQITDGQIQAATTTAKPAAPVSQITDGQIQAATTTAKAANPVSQITDGQVQAATGMVTVTVTKNNCVASPITQISDGQIQAPMATPVTQISDGQIQAATSAAKVGTAVSQIRDGQIQAATSTAKTGSAVAQITDGQIQAASTLKTSTKAATTAAAAASTGFAKLSGAAQACATSGTLEVSLKNSILTDSKNRTGYVAANYQFQFDNPPQTGAIYTAGWSFCGNDTLALGSSTTFYQCLSGTFYNLYFYPSGYTVPAQCQPVQIEAIQLNQC